MLEDIRAWLDEMPARQLAEHLIGGIAMCELPVKPYGMMGHYLEPTDFVVPPLPNTLFTRDTTCWIYNGVTLNPMFWPARRHETLLTAAIYKFHPDFKSAEFDVWWGDPDVDHQRATVEGGDVMPIGNGVVLIGMGERTTPQAVGQIARSLFQHQAATRVVGARCRRAGRPCTSTRCSPCATATSAPSSRAWSTRSDLHGAPRRPGGRDRHPRREPAVPRGRGDALGLKELRVVTTGGDAYEDEREQWDDGNNVVALEPGVVVAYDRNTYTNTKLRKAGIEVITIRGSRARARARRRPLHDLPDPARPGRLSRQDPRETATMAFNLRNRSLLTVQDYTQREFKYLLDLARDLKRAKYARTEQKHLKGKEICLIFEKTSTRTRCAFEVACHDQGATSPTSTRRARRSATRNRPRTRPACSAACTTRSSTAAPARRSSRSSPSTPACRSTTGSPTSTTRPRCWPT